MMPNPLPPQPAATRSAGRCAVLALALLLAAGPALAQSAPPPAAPVPAAPVPAPPAAGAPADAGAAAADPAAADPANPALAEQALAEGTLPHDLSPWGMFLAADIVVQAVMVGLAIASVLTWTVWLAKSLELQAARRRVAAALDAMATAATLPEAAKAVNGERGPAAALLRAAEIELRLSADTMGEGAREGIKERVASRLDRIVHAAGRRMTRGTGLLATIGATAPFVGLFGTVWGIMNAFVGIARTQTTNLAVVAPGIAEALLATAIGLVAAIPAVIIYNVFARAIAGYRADVTDAAAEVLRLVSRDLDRPGAGSPFAKAAE